MHPRLFGSLFTLFLFLSLILAADNNPPPGVLVTLKGHKEAVYALAFTADGKHVLTASGDPSVKVWDAATGKDLKTFAGVTGHKGLILGLALSPDGTQFATAGADNTARIWDFPSSKPLREFALAAEGHTVAVTADGTRIAGGDNNGTIRLWTASDGKQLHEIPAHTGAVTGLAFSPNGQLLASVGHDATLRYWNANDGKPITAFAAHSGPITGVTFSPNNNATYTTGADGTLRFWTLPPVPTRSLATPFAEPVTSVSLSPDGGQVVAASGKTARLSALATGQTLKEFTSTDTLTRVATTAGGAYVAAGTKDRHVLLWQTKDGTLLMRQPAHAGTVTGVAFHPAGSQLATIGSDGVLRLFAMPAAPPRVVNQPDPVRTATLSSDGKRLATGDRSIRLYKLDNLKTPERQLTGPIAPVNALSFHSDGQRLVSGGDDALLRFWNVDKGEQTATLGAHTGALTSVIWLGDRVLSTAADGSVKMWQVPTAGKSPFSHAGEVSSIALSPDGTRLLTGCNDKQVRAWNVATGQLERTWTGPTLGVLSVAFSPKGDRVAAGSADKTLFVWEAGSTKVVQKVSDLPGVVQTLAFTPDGKDVVAGLGDGSVRVVELATGKVVRTLDGHKGSVNAVVLSAKGEQILSAGGDGVVLVRPLAGGAPVQTWTHKGAVHALAMSREGQRVAVGGADKVVRVYSLASGKIETTFTTPAEVKGLAFSPDGKRFVVAGSDGRARLYGATGVLEEYLPHDGAVNAVMFTPDGKSTYTASADKTARAWTPGLLWQGRHEGGVRQAIVSPSGDRVYSCGDDGFVRLWSFADGKSLGAFRALGGAVVGLSLSGDGTRLATAGVDKSVQLLDAAKPGDKPLLTIPLPASPTAVTLSPNGQKLVVGVSGKDSVRIYDAATGKELLAFGESATTSLRFLGDSRMLLLTEGRETRFVDVNVITAFAAHTGGCTNVAFRDNGTQILTGGADRSVKLWTLASGKVEKSYGPLLSAIDSLTLARGGTHVAATAGKLLSVWDVATGKQEYVQEMPTSARGVAFTGDRTRLATAGEDGKARVWDVALRREVQAFLHAGPVTDVAFHPATANQLITASFDRTLGIHTLTSSRIVGAGTPLHGVTATVTHVVTAGADGKVRLTNPTTGNVDRTCDAGDKPVTCVAVSRNGVLIAAGGSDGKVRVFTANDARVLSVFTAPSEPRSLAFSANNQALVAAGKDGTLTSWDVAYNQGQPPPVDFGKVVQAYQQGGAANGVAFPASGNVFYSSGADRQVKAWKLASESALRTLAHPNTVNAIAYNKEGTLLATGAGDGRLRLWDPSKGAIVREVNAHPVPNNDGPIYAVAFSPDGKHVVTGSKDQSLKLVQVADGKIVREFKAYKEKEFPKGHQDAVLSVAFSPDGKQLASGSADRTIKIWNVADGAVLQELVNPAYKGGAHPGWVYAVSYVGGGKRLLSVGAAPRLRGYVAAWDAGSGRLLSGQEMNFGTVFALGVSPDERVLGLGTGGSVRADRDLNLGLLVPLPR